MNNFAQDTDTDGHNNINEAKSYDHGLYINRPITATNNALSYQFCSARQHLISERRNVYLR